MPWQLCLGRKIYFYLHSKGTIFALILNQKDVNPGTGLWCMMLLMDKNARGPPGDEKHAFPHFREYPRTFLFLYFCTFFFKVVLHSTPNKRCTVLSCKNESNVKRGIWIIPLSPRPTAFTVKSFEQPVVQKAQKPSFVLIVWFIATTIMGR